MVPQCMEWCCCVGKRRHAGHGRWTDQSFALHSLIPRIVWQDIRWFSFLFALPLFAPLPLWCLRLHLRSSCTFLWSVGPGSGIPLGCMFFLPPWFRALWLRRGWCEVLIVANTPMSETFVAFGILATDNSFAVGAFPWRRLGRLHVDHLFVVNGCSHLSKVHWVCRMVLSQSPDNGFALCPMQMDKSSPVQPQQATPDGA